MPRPIQTSGTKVCTTCRVEKNIDEFYFRGGKYSPNSRKSKCKECYLCGGRIRIIRDTESEEKQAEFELAHPPSPSSSKTLGETTD